MAIYVKLELLAVLRVDLYVSILFVATTKQIISALIRSNSFVTRDVEFEVQHRNKIKNDYNTFLVNDYEGRKKNFEKFSFVTAIQADASNFDFKTISPIKFAFLDVDLYLPTLACLKNIAPHMIAGSVVMVDDVADNNKWDGAYHAFIEFTRNSNLNYKFIGNKCGMIEF